MTIDADTSRDRRAVLRSQPQGTLRIVSRDFTTETCCAFCDHKLHSGTALMLRGSEFGDVPAGPSCGRKWGRKDPAFVDYTTGMDFGEPDDHERRDGEPSRAGTRRAEPRTPDEALRRYLALRFDRLGGMGFTGQKGNKLLAVLHAKLGEGTATAEDYRQGHGLVAAIPADKADVQPENLLRCYQAARIIEICLSRSQNAAGLLNSFDEQLKKRLYLTEPQMRKLNEQAARRSKSLVTLRADAFAGIVALKQVPFQPNVPSPAAYRLA